MWDYEAVRTPCPNSSINAKGFANLVFSSLPRFSRPTFFLLLPFVGWPITGPHLFATNYLSEREREGSERGKGVLTKGVLLTVAGGSGMARRFNIIYKMFTFDVERRGWFLKLFLLLNKPFTAFISVWIRTVYYRREKNNDSIERF